MGKKNEIAKELASKMNMPETLANRVVQEVLDEIIELLCALRVEHQTTLIIATHDAAIAERAARTVHLRDGVIADAAGAA